MGLGIVNPYASQYTQTQMYAQTCRAHFIKERTLGVRVPSFNGAHGSARRVRHCTHCTGVRGALSCSTDR